MVILLPLMRAMPPVHRWRIRRRIYRWYARLRRIDERLRSDLTPQQAAKHLAWLASLEHEIATLRVPLSYMQEFYHLRLHLGYIRGRLAANVRDASRGAPKPPHQAKTARRPAADKQA